MKYNHILILLLNLQFLPVCYTQKIELKGIEISLEAGISNISNHTVIENRYFPVYSPSLSLYTNFNFIKSIQFSTGISFERRGGSPNNKYVELLGEYPNYFLGTEIVLSKNLNSFGYITLPFLTKLSIVDNKKYSIDISAGFYQSLLLAQVFTYKNNNSEKILLPLVDSQNEVYKKYDLGYVLGLDLIYNFTHNYSIKIGIDYQKGLTDFIKQPEIKAFHKRQYVGIGMQYNL